MTMEAYGYSKFIRVVDKFIQPKIESTRNNFQRINASITFALEI